MYCDPPYRNTTGYSGQSFDGEQFDLWAERLALSDRYVYVSESNAPKHWEVLGEWNRSKAGGSGLSSKRKAAPPDRLYKVVSR